MEVWQNGTRLQANFFANTPLSTQTISERGLLGVAFDPNYASNHFVYVYYTTTAADNHNRVSRFTADASGDLALAGSETVLLELDPHTAGNHNGGAIHFGPDGKLYIAVGDDANQDNSTGTPNAQRLSTLHGKLLRINADGAIPSDNPFVSQTTGKYQAIWAAGLRNPFTFTFQPGTGRMFINDVGQNTWEEIDVGAVRGQLRLADHRRHVRSGRVPEFHRARSTPTSQRRVTTPSGIAITGGAFYNPTTNQFGADYTGDYFFADFGGNWIYRIDPTTKAVTQFATNISSPVDLKVDGAGNLYYLARGSGQVFVVSKPTAAASEMVTNTSDSGPGSLRAAILSANANSGLQTIQFNIVGAGVHSIHLLTALPNIADAAVIDGTSQPGYTGTPLIELDGSGIAAAGTDGLKITAGGSTVKGLAINRFKGDGIELASANNSVQANYLGTDAATGGTDLGNKAYGLNVSTVGNTIGGTTAAERNVISGNDVAGILISGSGATGNVDRGQLHRHQRQRRCGPGEHDLRRRRLAIAGNTIGDQRRRQRDLRQQHRRGLCDRRQRHEQHHRGQHDRRERRRRRPTWATRPTASTVSNAGATRSAAPRPPRAT